MDEGRNVYFGILPLAVPLLCHPDLLGEGFHTDIGGIPVKLGLPEGSDGEMLKAPQIVSRYDVSTQWGKMDGGNAIVQTLFFGFQGSEEEAETIWQEAGHWSAKLQNLCLLSYALPEDPEQMDGTGEELQIYRMCLDGSVCLEHHRAEHTLPRLHPEGAPYSRETMEALLHRVSSGQVIEQSYAVLLGAFRAWLDGDDFTAGELGGAALEMASAKYITAHADQAGGPIADIILEEEKSIQFEMLARLGLEIPGDWEDRIIGVYGDMKYGRLTPSHETTREFLGNCRKVMGLCIPEYLID